MVRTRPVFAQTVTNVVIVADNTDVYILLLYHYQAESLTVHMTLQSTQSDRAFIDIPASVQSLQNIVPQLLPAHALSGCDAVAMCHGIGKTKMLKAVQSSKCSISLLGDINAPMKDIIKQVTDFMCKCYNSLDATTMTEARITAWLTKTGRKSALRIPKLCSLPPTTEAFEENVKRAHFQCVIWRNALQEPPDLDPTKYGWSKDDNTNSFKPIMLPSYKSPVPDHILKLDCRSCTSETPCSSSKCGCVAAYLACMVFCPCRGGLDCRNEQIRAVNEESDEDC